MKRKINMAGGFQSFSRHMDSAVSQNLQDLGMMEKIKINGIRVNKNYIQLTQEAIDRQGPSILHQTMESNRINMAFMSLNAMGKNAFVSVSIDSRHFGQIAHLDESLLCHPHVCTLSMYPHHYRLKLIGCLLRLVGRQKISFHQMVSSSALLTVVMDQDKCSAAIEMLSAIFDLPDSHAPFEQAENDDVTQFLKKKYPETRATYVEVKIKTYGITVVPDLIVTSYLFSFDQLAGFGQTLQSMEDRFFHYSARMISPEHISVFLLTEKMPEVPNSQVFCADFISFQGPHFGDRHSIISRAMNCLLKKSIPVLQVGCTGAHVGIVLQQGMGNAAKRALTEVFENP